MRFAPPTIRPPAVAGRFYPGQADALRETVHSLNADAARQFNAAAETTFVPGAGVLKALIVPHAGYVFSGPVAASVYHLIHQQAERIRRVVLFGPAHYEAFTGLAVPSAEAFDSPLGSVCVDRAAVDQLLEQPFIHENDPAHAPEHSLEVHLPFLIDALGGCEGFTLVPMLFGDADMEQAATALETVWGGDETLIVISSDLSHFLDHATATRTDRDTADMILAGQPQSLGPHQACGYVAIGGLMRLAERDALTCYCVDLRNSGDTKPELPGSQDRVVGYGGFIYQA